MRRVYPLLLLLLAIVSFLPIFLAPNPPSLAGDGLGHLFKVKELMTGGWKPWIEEWYAGFPFLRFYPPASYLMAAFLGRLLGSDVKGYGATLMVTAFLGALALHAYLKRLKKEPYIAPVLFLLFPWHLGVAYSEGNFPRANAINLSPLFLLGIFLLRERRERYLLLSSLGISLVMLTHHSILVPLLVMALVLHWDDLKSVHSVGNSLRVVGATIFLTAFWYVPFFYDGRWVSFWSIPSNVWLFRSGSIRPATLAEPLVIISVFLPMLLWGLLKGRSGDYRKPALLLASLYLSLGCYSPTPWVHSVPPLSMIPPYRWLDLTNLLVPLIVADAVTDVENRRKILAALLIAIMVPGLLKEAQAIGGVPQDTLELAEYLKEQSGSEWRFIVNSSGAVYSYLPTISHKDTLNGWYHEGNPVDKEMGRLWYLLLHGGNATFYLKAYCVRFLVNARQESYHEVAKIGRYVVYEGNTSFVQPVSVVMSGTFYELPFDYAYLRELPGNLSESIVVIYAGNPDNATEERLTEFVKRGGTLIWVPETRGEAFGVNATVMEINQSLLSSEVYNVSRFEPFVYEDGPWFGPVLKNITPLVRMGNWSLIGTKEIGAGRVYAFGGNFLFHIAYTGSRYELEMIKGLCPEIRVTVKNTIRGEGRYSFSVEDYGEFLLRVSEAYFPHWEVQAEGTSPSVFRDDRTGLTLIEINGPTNVSARFRDPFIKLRLYSALAWITLLGYSIVKFRPMR